MQNVLRSNNHQLNMKLWIGLLVICAVIILVPLGTYVFGAKGVQVVEYKKIDALNLPKNPKVGVIHVPDTDTSIYITECTPNNFGLKLYGTRGSLRNNKNLPCTWPNIWDALTELMEKFDKTPGRWTAPSTVDAINAFVKKTLLQAIRIRPTLP